MPLMCRPGWFRPFTADLQQMLCRLGGREICYWGPLPALSPAAISQGILIKSTHLHHLRSIMQSLSIHGEKKAFLHQAIFWSQKDPFRSYNSKPLPTSHPRWEAHSNFQTPRTPRQGGGWQMWPLYVKYSLSNSTNILLEGQVVHTSGRLKITRGHMGEGNPCPRENLLIYSFPK